MSKLYYTAPSDEIFNEIKASAIRIWAGYNDDHGYATEKTQRILEMKNIEDNAMYMVAMFDQVNQGKLASILSAEAREAIRERMIDGGRPKDLITF